MSNKGNQHVPGVPLLRHVLDRPALVSGVLEQPSPVVVLCAPGGYGKTTVAAQVVSQLAQPVLWLDCAAVESSERLWLRVRQECAPLSMPTDQRYDLLPVQNPDETAAQAVEDALEALGDPGWVVLDSIEFRDDGLAYHEVEVFLKALIRQGHRVLITTRSPDVVPGGSGAAIYSADRLVLSVPEVHQLGDLLGVSLDTRGAARVCDTANGQVALVVTLLGWARQESLDSALSAERGRDLSGMLRGLVASQMGDSGIDLFHAAAILREGSVTQLRRAAGDVPLGFLEFGASCVPLLGLEREHGVPSQFRLHDLGVSAFETVAQTDESRDGVLRSSLRELVDEARHSDCLRVLLKHDQTSDLPDCLEDWGDSVLAQGDVGLLQTALDTVDPAAYLGRPRLLLLQASVYREQGDPIQASTKASIACDLARADDDLDTLARSLEMMARTYIDMGSLGKAKATLEELLRMEPSITNASVRALAASYLALCVASAGETQVAVGYVGMAEETVASNTTPVDVQGRVLTARTCVEALLLGNVASVVAPLAELVSRDGLSIGLRLQTENNYAYVLLETGRVQQALEVLDRLEARALAAGLSSILPAAYITAAETVAAMGKFDEANRYRSLALENSELAAIDRIGAYVTAPMWIRAFGDPDEALRVAEECLALLGSAPHTLSEWQAILEIAASLLALGDVRAAKQRASSVRRDAGQAGAAYHILRADMILAEVARLEDGLPSAVEHLGQHREYILTESSNWQIGMYIRSFPSLLGVVATAIDPDDLPIHLLKMVLPEDAEEALLAAREIMDPDPWMRLALRIVDEDEAVRLRDGDGPQECRVRMFGGLNVKVGDRVVVDRDWRKRKARLLFAILTLNRGHDVSRDQILEYLWPDMDDERARNNLYVIWSSMKSALSPDAEKGEPCPYIDNSTGMLRSVAEHIRSDVDDFEEHLAAAESAALDGNNRAALKSYDRIYGIYRGDLLPGDLYEDWFAATRDRYRQEFGDAMLAASELLLVEGEASRALKYVRKALDHDPWREDLYQAALRCQIASGQRSAAVDTFFSCKDKLAEELGLDPSQETVRLYDQVLAMEDAAEGYSTSY